MGALLLPSSHHRRARPCGCHPIASLRFWPRPRKLLICDGCALTPDSHHRHARIRGCRPIADLGSRLDVVSYWVNARWVRSYSQALTLARKGHAREPPGPRPQIRTKRLKLVTLMAYSAALLLPSSHHRAGKGTGTPPSHGPQLRLDLINY